MDLAANGGDDDRWDDTAIVQAFNRAVELHDAPKSLTGENGPGNGDGTCPAKNMAFPDFVNKAQDSQETTQDNSGNASGRSGFMPAMAGMPSIPAGATAGGGADMQQQKDLSALLLAWYQAGYQAGKYEALYCSASQAGRQNEKM